MADDKGDAEHTNYFVDAMLRPRSAGQNKFIERTREYPFRLGLGPAASPEYLAGERAINMNEAQSISDAVPRGTGKRGDKSKPKSRLSDMK
jgi:phosphate starvation-inducible protein PhoH